MLFEELRFSFVLLLYLNCAQGNLFTSAENFQESKNAAVELVEKIDQYIKQEEFKIEVLKSISKNIQNQLAGGLNGAKLTLPNPVSMYLYAKTISEAAHSISKLSTKSENDTKLQRLQSLFTSQLPGHVDVRGILKSFIRLQNTYNVTAGEMASGNVLGIKVPVLSAYDCYDIGVFVFKTGLTRIALQWVRTAIEKANHLDNKKAKTISADLNDLIKEIERQYIKKHSKSACSWVKRSKISTTYSVSMYLYAKTISEAAHSISKLSTRTENDTKLPGLQALFNSQLPGQVDVQGILKSFIRLQNTYNVTAGQMASGNVLGIKVPVLSAYDCYDIGAFVFKTGLTRIALQWVRTAIEKANHLDYKKATTLSADLNDLITDIEKQDRTDRLQTKRQILFNQLPGFHASEVKELQEMDIRYDGVCKYIGITELFFYKQPIKVEYINKSPMILIVHDIISQKLIKKLTGFTNQLKRSTVKNPAAVSEEDKNVLSELRISSTYYFKNDTTDPDVTKLNDRLERLTGLRTNPHQADHLQVVNYGIGGEFQPHFDWMNDRKSLSDVQVGGSTVFPELGLAVSPVKGSALFFTNLDKDGHGDLSTLHAGCPVFFGSKWIANKWIHKKDQDINFLQTIPSIWEHF